MSIGGVHLGAPSAAVIETILQHARSASPTYAPVGNTLVDDIRPGVHVESMIVGRGCNDFEAARIALLHWVLQRRIGADVVPPRQALELGATVLLIIRRGPACIVAVNRVVALIDQPHRFAYAYGTLSGHPERGEEAFIVDLLDDESIRLTIRVAAEPATRIGRLLAPIVRLLQRAALRRYLAAVADHVSPRSPRVPSSHIDRAGHSGSTSRR